MRFCKEEFGFAISKEKKTILEK